MAVDTLPGFRFMYRESGQPPTIQTFKSKDTETLHKGDMVNLESGEIDLAATNDAALLGVIWTPPGTTSAVDSTTDFQVIVDHDAVYAVYDANARAAGATLDIAGATGAMTLATNSNADVVVVAPSTADEWTLVKIIPANHPYHL